MKSFEERYQNGDTPWNYGLPDRNLTELVESFPIKPCNALDLGCGTGTNSIWLAQQGFIATGCDISKTAIEMAKKKAAAAGVECTFLTIDFLSQSSPNSPFKFVFDLGCLHSIKDTQDRCLFVEKVASCLVSGGIWLDITGNADEPKRKVGPPRLSAAELITAVEPCFEVISLSSGHFGSAQEKPPKAWICLMRKRAVQAGSLAS